MPDDALKLPDGSTLYRNRVGADWLYVPVADRHDARGLDILIDSHRALGWAFAHFKPDWSELIFSRPVHA